MKKLFLLLSVSPALLVSAQRGPAPATSIQLTKGQNIVVVTETDMTMDMGMGGEIKNNNKATTTLSVLDMSGSDYKISNTLNKISMSMDMMGQTTSYDSEKPGEESEMSKAVSEKVGKSETGILNSLTGVFKADKADNEDESANPLQAIMGGGDEAKSTSKAFFIIPTGKNVGDSWTTTDSANGTKHTNTYTFKSTESNIATIELTEISLTNTEMEMQGMQMNLAMNSKTTGNMTVDINKAILKKRTENLEIEGTIEVMGQTTPISATGTSVTTFSF
jgi:hypothetical protein